MSLDFVKTGSDRPHALVVGAGFGGLAVAMRLGASGWRVTVLDRLDEPGGRATAIRSRGHRFDLGPTMMTDPDALRRLFLECGHDPDVLRLRAPDPAWTLTWPDGSRLPARADGMLREVERLAPGDAPAWRSLWSEALRRPAPPCHALGRLGRRLGALRRRSLMGRVAARMRDDRLRLAMACPPILLGRDPRSAPADHALPHVLRRGLVAAEGGLGTVIREMVAAIEARGGTLRQPVEVAAVAAGRVRLSTGEVLRGDAVIVGTAPPQRRAPAGAMGLFVWNFGTRDTRDLWPDTGAHTMLAGRDFARMLRDVAGGRLPDDPLIHLHRASVFDRSAAPEGGDTFYALVPVPHLGHARPIRWTDRAGELRQRVRDVLDDRALPGFGAHVTTSFCLTPEDMRDRYASAHGLAAGGGWAGASAPGVLHLTPGPEGGVAGAIAGAEALVRNLPLSSCRRAALRPPEPGRQPR